jgi:hypothetical protein
MSGDAAMAIRLDRETFGVTESMRAGRKIFFERNAAGNGLWRSADWESGLGPGRLSLHNQTDTEFSKPGDRHP